MQQHFHANLNGTISNALSSFLSPNFTSSILGRIIRVTQEVDDYRDWISKQWGRPPQSDSAINSRSYAL